MLKFVLASTRHDVNFNASSTGKINHMYMLIVLAKRSKKKTELTFSRAML
jgi:hypothetical protein